MKKLAAGILMFVFVAMMVPPVSAQLIDWNRREGIGAPAATAPVATAPARVREPVPMPRVIATPAPEARTIEVRGIIVNLNRRGNEVVIRDAVDGERKTFIVDSDIMENLSRYDEVAIVHKENSNMAISVRLL